MRQSVVPARWFSAATQPGDAYGSGGSVVVVAAIVVVVGVEVVVEAATVVDGATVVVGAAAGGSDEQAISSIAASAHHTGRDPRDAMRARLREPPPVGVDLRLQASGRVRSCAGSC